MGINAEIALAAANAYTEETVIGGGALKGKNCTIQSKTPIEGGTRITFKWTLDNGTEQTTTLDVMNGVDGEDGAPGDDGFSPVVSTQSIEGGTEVTITDAEGDHTFDVMNGTVGGGSSYAGKNVVHFGDSIIDICHVAEKSAEKLGYNVTNVGFQATSFVDRQNLLTNSKYYSLISLIRSLESNDWSEQDNHTNQDFAAHLAALKAVDWSEVDVVILSYGTNDYLCQCDLGDTYAKDTASVCGVIKKAINVLETLNSNMEIIITTPIYRVIDPDSDEQKKVWQNNHCFYEYRNAIVLTAAAMGVKVVDLYANSGINEGNASLALSDGLHPNSVGQEMWATAFANSIGNGYVGGLVTEAPIYERIDNFVDNITQDSQIFNAHMKTNATFVYDKRKYLCAAGDDAGAECVFASKVYASIPSGKHFHFNATCVSTTQDEHRIGIRFWDNNAKEDVLDQYSAITSSRGARGVDFTTTEAYTNVVAIFYVRNMTAFSTSQALAQAPNCTVS